MAEPVPGWRTAVVGLLRRIALSLVLLSGLGMTACAGGTSRIVAFGDVHGDLAATRAALRLAGAVDARDRWIGGDLVVVQTGDQLDRGDEEQAILDLFDRLREEAAAAGGAFHALVGNHELMNVAGDLRYVTPGGLADFNDAVDYDPADPALAGFEPDQRARLAAFLPGGPYARRLARRSVILQVGGNVFVHGGVLPSHVDFGIRRLNEAARSWMRGERDRPEILQGADSPQWSRLYSRETDARACATLAAVLDELGADRMIMGHTVQPGGINAACDGRAWRIDVGLAQRYGGPLQVLEIVGDSVRVLRARRGSGLRGVPAEPQDRGTPAVRSGPPAPVEPPQEPCVEPACPPRPHPPVGPSWSP